MMSRAGRAGRRFAWLWWDLARVQAALPDAEVLVVPDDRAIEDADREARAPLDVAPDSPGVQALTVIAERLLGRPAPGVEE